MSHEEEELDSSNQYKFKHLSCNEKRNSLRGGGFLYKQSLLSTLKLMVSISTLCLIIVILTKLHFPRGNIRNMETISGSLTAGKAQTTPEMPQKTSEMPQTNDEIPMEPYYHYIPSSINEPLEGQFYIIMPTGSKYALTNEAGLITLSSYTFEDKQKFRFWLNGRRGSPKKFSIIDKSGNYFLGLGGNQTKLMGFEKGGSEEITFDWLVRDQTHREGSFQIVSSTSDSCLAFNNEETSVILEDCAPYRVAQYWLVLPICGEIFPLA